MPFFQEYTAHDENHINAVLAIADALIPWDTLKTLDSTTVEILISAIIIHDLGMLIQHNGLNELLFGRFSARKIKGLDDLTWQEAWNSYLHSYKRMSTTQLYGIFGDLQPIIILDENRVDSSENAWRVYGDFLRIHHPRLAHDIAEIGFPGNKEIDLFDHCFTSDDMNYIRGIIGVIARSHGMSMYGTQKFLNEFPLTTNSNVTMYKGVPVYYLMAVLRMADYIHAGTSRAPNERDKAQKLESPISRYEFGWNQAVYDEMTWHISRKTIGKQAGKSDMKRSKTLEIIADPKDNTTYLKIEGWLNDIQAELITCWAMLAEKYDNTYQLSIHRITTNIFKESEVQRFNKKYLTKHAVLTANPDIVKLLIAPLYGESPSYGVRELLQNSVDACNERILWTKKENIRRDIEGLKPLGCPEGLISVIIDTESAKKTLTIIDNGIGMNADILLDYYLVAGASYRESSLWREKYIGDDGEPELLRSGRFGIGALATFLLGDIADITTRYACDENGYSFKYWISKRDLINVECVSSVAIGTKIEIMLNDKSVEFFNKECKDVIFSPDWSQWFCFKKPKIIYTLNGKNNVNAAPLKIPDGNEAEALYPYWYKVELSNGVICFWMAALSTGYETFFSVVFCNGIRIEQGHNLFDKLSNLRLPLGGRICVSFLDRHGLLPISLNRNHLYYIEEFDDILLDVCRYILARIIYQEIGENDNYAQIGYSNNLIKWNGDDNGIIYGFCKKGFIPLFAEFLILCNIKTIKCILLDDPNVCLDKEFLAKTITENTAKNEGFLTVMVIGDPPSYKKVVAPHCLYFCDRQFDLEEKKVSLVGMNKRKQKYAFYSTKQNLTDISHGGSHQRKESLMNKVIEEFLGERNTYLFSDDYWIPFDLEERKRKFPKAFSALTKYIDGRRIMSLGLPTIPTHLL